MDTAPPDVGFTTVSRLHPYGAAHWAAHPRKLLRALGHATVAIRVDPRRGDGWSPGASWWTLDRRRYGDRVAICFASERGVHYAPRWRIVADAIWNLALRRADLVFHDWPLELGDGAIPGMPAGVNTFARPAGTSYGLVPNPYLLRPRPWLLPPLPWAWKTDTLYFRGSSTGSRDYDRNLRVALCRLARTLPRADCKLSRTRASDPNFRARLVADRIVGRRQPLDALNLHRFLVDVDGHVSSWDRFLLIGHCGGVPIRFEPAWEECWHHLLVDGGNCVQVDRHTLPTRLAGLRGAPEAARRIAAAARRLVGEHLSRPALVEMLGRSLAAHDRGSVAERDVGRHAPDG